MGPISYIRYVVDRNVVMMRMTVHSITRSAAVSSFNWPHSMPLARSRLLVNCLAKSK